MLEDEKKKERRFTLVISEKLFERIRREAFRTKKSVGATIRKLVVDGLCKNTE